MHPVYPQPRAASLTGSIQDFLVRFPVGIPALWAVLGGTIGFGMALLLYVTKPLLIALPIAGLLVTIPTLLMREKQLYWLGIFLFALQFEIQKNLNNGLAVVDRLNIDYTIWHFTFVLRGTDLILVVLLFYWYVESAFRGKRLYFPRAAWLIIGFFAFCVLSLVSAPSPYLGFVEISRQLKFFVLFLYVVNNVKSKATLRLVAILAVAILTIQGAATATRFYSGWMTPLTFGSTGQEEDEILQYLSVDRSEEGSMVRAFGTLNSPGSTLRLCVLVIPFALLLSMRNPMFQYRLLFLSLTLFGMGALLLTFTRSYYLTAAVQIAAAVLIGIRHRYLPRLEVLLLVVVGLGAMGKAVPKLYEHLMLRQDSVTVRYQQYKAALDMIVDNPVFGVGLNNGTGVKERYVNVTYNEHDPDTQFYLEPTHNLYLSLASEIGLIGSALYFAFFGVVVARIWRLSNTLPDPELRFFANAILIAFAGIIVNSMYDPLPEDAAMNMLWLYCGIAFALARMAPGARNEGAAAVMPIGSDDTATRRERRRR